MNSIVDLFKVCKVIDLKQVQKKGNVRYTHQKSLGRKVISIEGNVSSANYLKFPIAAPKQPLNNRYLYIQCLAQPGRIFSLLLTVHCNAKCYKLHLSSLHKSTKQSNSNTLSLPISAPTSKWSLLVLDLFDLSSQMISPNELKLSFELAEIELRACMKVKGMFMSDRFYSVEEMPKEMAMPLHGAELFYDKYAYEVVMAKGQENSHTGNQGKPDPEVKIRQSIEKKEVPKKRPDTTKKEGRSQQKKRSSSLQDKQKQAKTTKKVTFSDKLIDDQEIKQSKPPVPQHKASQIKPPILPKPTKARKPTMANQSTSNTIQQPQQLPLPQLPPAPSVTLSSTLLYHHGSSLTIGPLSALGHILFTPQPVQTHKPITLFHQISPVLTILAYNDGTMCLFNTMMKQPVRYFQTGLEIVTGMYPDARGVLVITGRDYMKRETIMIVENDAILFKQICNYDIKGLLLVDHNDYRAGMLTFGFENIRTWKVKKEVIVGASLYLGEFARKLSYNSGIMKDRDMAYVVASNGNLCVVDVNKAEIHEIVRLGDFSLDIIKPLNETSFVCSDQHGTIRVFSTATLTLCLQMPLQHRIQHLHISNPNQLILTHYNKTVGKLLLSQGKYQFVMRSHTDRIIDLKYHRQCKRLVTISEDNTIRLWRIFNDNLMQEYQFLVNDDIVTTLAVFNNTMEFVVGFRSGILRRFDMRQCKMTMERNYHEESIVKIDIDRSDKHVLTADRNGTVCLMDNTLEILKQFQATPQDSLQLCFNRTTPHFCLTSTQLQITIYSLKTLQPIRTLYLESTPESLFFQGDLLHLLSRQEQTLITYRNFKFERMVKLTPFDRFTMDYPLAVQCLDREVRLGVLGSQLVEKVVVPEPMEGVLLPEGDDEGLMFMWGRESKAIYCWTVNARNLPRGELLPIQQQIEIIDEQPSFGNGQNQLDVTFSSSAVHQSPAKQSCFRQCSQNSASILPINLAVPSPEQLKMVLALNQPPEAAIAPHQQTTVSQQQNQFLMDISKKPARSQPISSTRITPNLLFGITLPATLTPMVWNTSQRYLVLPSHHHLLIHFFCKPYKQRILRLPFKPNQLRMCERYICIVNGNCLALYNTQTLGHFKSIILEGDAILSYAVSNCQGYVVVLTAFKNRSVVSVIDVATGRPVASSYLPCLDRSVLLVNPFKQQLEFTILTPSSLLFYRITSIQTLETQQLPLGNLISNTGSLISSTYLKLQKDQLIVLGSANGSLVVVDSRSAALLVLCSCIVKAPILEVRWVEDTLMVVTNTINLYLWRGIASLGELVEVVGEGQPEVVTMDAPICLLSQDNHTTQIIATSRLGVTWLIDISDKLTVKLFSTHTKPILCCDFLSSDIISTGSSDNSIKLTCLDNLEQLTEFYKPKKSVNCVKWIEELGILAAGQGNFLNFYTRESILGSFQLPHDLVQIQHIPNTRNLLVATKGQIMMVKIEEGQVFRIEINMITETTNNEQITTVEINMNDMYDCWLATCQSGKINVWARKCLKRMYNPLQQLGKVHQLEYYLIDNYLTKPPAPSPSLGSPPTIAHFTSINTYLCLNNNKLQQRNFKQHIVLREIQLEQELLITSFKIYQDRTYLIGTQNGEVCVADHNGITVEKMRVLDEGVKGMQVREHCLVVWGGDRAMVCHIS